MEQSDAERMDRVGLTRVELEGDFKCLYKQCTCGSEFRTTLPRGFFKNPNDESLELARSSNGTIIGNPDIRADAVQARIDNIQCNDQDRHPESV